MDMHAYMHAYMYTYTEHKCHHLWKEISFDLLLVL